MYNNYPDGIGRTLQQFATLVHPSASVQARNYGAVSTFEADLGLNRELVLDVSGSGEDIIGYFVGPIAGLRGISMTSMRKARQIYKGSFGERHRQAKNQLSFLGVNPLSDNDVSFDPEDPCIELFVEVPYQAMLTMDPSHIEGVKYAMGETEALRRMFRYHSKPRAKKLDQSGESKGDILTPERMGPHRLANSFSVSSLEHEVDTSSLQFISLGNGNYRTCLDQVEPGWDQNEQ